MRLSAAPAGVLAAHPGLRARAAADSLGNHELTRWCADLLSGRVAYGGPAQPAPAWPAGQMVHSWGSPARLDGPTAYWVKVWAARTLLYVWDETATADLVAACDDPAWRVLDHEGE